MNLNTKLYSELKAREAISIIHTKSENCAFVVKQFDMYTGVQLPDITDEFSVMKLRIAIQEHQARLQGMLTILADATPIMEAGIAVEKEKARIAKEQADAQAQAQAAINAEKRAQADARENAAKEKANAEQ